MDMTKDAMAHEDYGERCDFFTTPQVAVMLGVHVVTVRKWRTKNKDVGCIKFGPPYEFRGANVVYPKVGFRTWCSQVAMVDGVPRINLPVSATIGLPREPGHVQQSPVNEVEHGQ